MPNGKYNNIMTRNIYDDLGALVAINSIYDKPAQNAPFGISCRKALDKFVEIASDAGLRTGMDDGYAAWAEYGEGEKLAGVLGHLDIVPAGEGWTTDPFTLTVHDGVMYGRGVSDDKGPLLACLYALIGLKERGVDLGCRVRVIAGCNEESGSECIKHYVRHCEIPALSFTPDSDFPVIASEKGIRHFRVTLPATPLTESGIADVRAGERPNIVPDAAVCVVRRNSGLFVTLFGSEEKTGTGASYALEKHGSERASLSVATGDDAVTISSYGKAAHGSTPEKGVNALGGLFAALADASGDESLKAAALLTSADAAVRLGIACEDETGALTLNAGVCRYESGRITLTMDMRFPASADADKLTDKIMSAMPKGSTLVTEHTAPPLAFPEDHPLVRALSDVYRKATGDTVSRPLHIGGGTYAKELPGCIAFGAVFPGRETHMHEPDECYPVKDFELLVRIYGDAIVAMSKPVG